MAPKRKSAEVWVSPSGVEFTPSSPTAAVNLHAQGYRPKSGRDPFEAAQDAGPGDGPGEPAEPAATPAAAANTPPASGSPAAASK